MTSQLLNYLIFLFSFLIFNLKSTSQSILPDSFSIGNFIEVFKKDSIKIYYNCTGTVVNKKCAYNYRVGKMDTEIINVVGEFYDYDMQDNISLKATMQNNYLEGMAHYYYGNGKVKEEGIYQNNIRQGTWKFYYLNGNIQKIFNYENGEPNVVEAYSFDGKASVLNGNGSIKTDFSHYQQCDKFETFGPIVNGKKNGKWTFSYPNSSVTIASEIYQSGNFINGNSNNYEYFDNPKIELTNFYANEHLNLLDNLLGCPGESFSVLKFNNDDIHLSFYPLLQDKLSNYKKRINNQWLVVGLSLNKKNKIGLLNVSSSINDLTLEQYVYDLISKMDGWQAAIVNKKQNTSDIFFTILVDNNQIIIPTDYIFQQGGVNNK